jgi:hypothetical protein
MNSTNMILNERGQLTMGLLSGHQKCPFHQIPLKGKDYLLMTKLTPKIRLLVLAILVVSYGLHHQQFL